MNLQENIQRIKKLMGLNESNNILFESKKTEEQSINFLKKNNINDAESIVNMFASKDKSNNQKNIPIMSYLYFISNRDSNTVDIDTISNVVNEYDDLYIKNRIKPIQITKNGLVIGDKIFNNFLKFSEYINGLTNSYSKSNTNTSSQSTTRPVKKPMWSGNNIDIYKGDNVGKCIEYTQGGLTDRSYTFCIGQPGNTMYKSYRDSQESTFYFIIDRNRKNDDGSINLNDPLHIVVFDRTNNGIKLTDASNTTGTISRYGKDVNAYVDYLKSKGVPVDSLVNKQKTEQEKYEDELLGKRNEDLSWFINLDNPKNPNYKKPVLEPGQTELNYYKSAYIGRGHELSDQQFDFLIGIKNDDLLSQYVNTGLQLPKYQVEKLSKQHRKSYLRIRMRFKIDLYEFNLLTSEEKEMYFKNRDDDDDIYLAIRRLLSEDLMLVGSENDNRKIETDKTITDLLSLNTVIEYLKKISTSDLYRFQDLIAIFVTKSLEPEKVKNLLGDMWDKHVNLIDGWGNMEIQVSNSNQPDKVIKVYGKRAEDYIRNLDSEGVRRIIYSHNYDKMIKILLGFGISKKTINDALTYLNNRYQFKYELLPDDNSTNLQENIQRIKQMMGLITETRRGLMRYLTDVSQKLTGIEWPEYVLRDWLYRNTKEVGDMNPEMYKDLMKSYLESFVEGHGKGHWEFQVLDISLDKFTKFVQEDLTKKMGGYINPHVPKDEERHQTQISQLERGGVSPEPIIVVETKDGKYDLLEGWHRTTNALKKFGQYKQNAWVYKLD